MRKSAAILFLAVLFGLWLFPDIIGIGNGSSAQSADSDAIVVRDGDTMTIRGQDFRLHGIDAPEYGQLCKTVAGVDWTCGKQARTTLAAIIAGRRLTCVGRARDKYGRIVAICTDDQGTDIARGMIERGMAISMDGFAEGPYAVEQVRARAARRGIWQGAFDPPSSWRASHPRAAVANR